MQPGIHGRMILDVREYRGDIFNDQMVFPFLQETSHFKTVGRADADGGFLPVQAQGDDFIGTVQENGFLSGVFSA